MRRYLLILFFLLFQFSASCQIKNGYYLTNEQHELLRKDLKDYKILIQKYNVLSKDFEKLKAEFAMLKMLHSKQISELENSRTQSVDTHNLLIKISNLEEDKKKGTETVKRLERELDYKNKSLYTYKAKYTRELKKNRGDRIIGNSILGLFIMCGMWGIYISLESNYNVF